MVRYIALIRGINVGGNNKVTMSILKSELEKIGYKDVITYINSGNVIFSSNETNLEKLVYQHEKLLEDVFKVKTRVAIISVEEFHNAVKAAPIWWSKKEDEVVKHNALFIISPATAQEVIKQVGEAKPEYEKIAYAQHVIFWSAPLKTFGRTRWSKITNTSAYNSITIRNANTVNKLIQLTDSSK